MTYALDTNIISYLLKNDETVIQRYLAENLSDNEIIIPPIVVHEILRGLLARKMNKRLRAFHDFCQDIEIGIFNTEVWVEASHIYANLSQLGKLIDDADLFIAAFCIVNNLTLVTANTRHFENIEGLKFTNWKE